MTVLILKEFFLFHFVLKNLFFNELLLTTLKIYKDKWIVKNLYCLISSGGGYKQPKYLWLVQFPAEDWCVPPVQLKTIQQATGCLFRLNTRKKCCQYKVIIQIPGPDWFSSHGNQNSWQASATKDIFIYILLVIRKVIIAMLARMNDMFIRGQEKNYFSAGQNFEQCERWGLSRLLVIGSLLNWKII